MVLPHQSENLSPGPFINAESSGIRIAEYEAGRVVSDYKTGLADTASEPELITTIKSYLDDVVGPCDESFEFSQQFCTFRHTLDGADRWLRPKILVAVISGMAERISEPARVLNLLTTQVTYEGQKFSPTEWMLTCDIKDFAGDNFSRILHLAKSTNPTR